jgi:beta-galactosidase
VRIQHQRTFRGIGTNTKKVNLILQAKLHPARNLIKYIKLCKKNGLQLIVKPGPYILAEYEAEGLPGWLLKRISKNSFALDEFGNIISPNIVSYMSDEFLEYTFRWYDRIMPLIANYQESNKVRYNDAGL